MGPKNLASLLDVVLGFRQKMKQRVINLAHSTSFTCFQLVYWSRCSLLSFLPLSSQIFRLLQSSVIRVDSLTKCLHSNFCNSRHTSIFWMFHSLLDKLQNILLLPWPPILLLKYFFILKYLWPAIILLLLQSLNSEKSPEFVFLQEKLFHLIFSTSLGIFVITVLICIFNTVTGSFIPIPRTWGCTHLRIYDENVGPCFPKDLSNSALCNTSMYFWCDLQMWFWDFRNLQSTLTNFASSSLHQTYALWTGQLAFLCLKSFICCPVTDSIMAVPTLVFTKLVPDTHLVYYWDVYFRICKKRMSGAKF